MASIASRETFAGLQNDWGTLKMGKFLTPYDDVHPIFGNAPTLFDVHSLDSGALGAGIATARARAASTPALATRSATRSPTLNGFSAELQYSTRDSSGNADGAAGDNGDHTSELRHASVWSFGAFYSNGPLDLGFAYEMQRQDSRHGPPRRRLHRRGRLRLRIDGKPLRAASRGGLRTTCATIRRRAI